MLWINHLRCDQLTHESAKKQNKKRQKIKRRREHFSHMRQNKAARLQMDASALISPSLSLLFNVDGLCCIHTSVPKVQIISQLNLYPLYL